MRQGFACLNCCKISSDHTSANYFFLKWQRITWNRLRPKAWPPCWPNCGINNPREFSQCNRKSLKVDMWGYVHFTEGLVLGCFWVLMVGDEQIPTNSTWEGQHQHWINHVNLQSKDESLCCCSYCNWNFNRFNHVFRLEYIIYIHLYTVDIPFKYRPPNGFINTTSKMYPRFDQHLYPHFVSWLKVFLFPLHSDQQVGGSYLVGDPDSLI